MTALLESDSILPAYCTKRTLILGCGNVLFGDDGFGPAVIEHLVATHLVPDDVYLGDAGTGIRKLLFTLCLSPTRPEEIVIIDAMDNGRRPGEIFDVPLAAVPSNKTDDFSLHQAPSSNLAKEIQDAGVRVRIIGCQVAVIPDSIRPGLSEAVARSVPLLARQIAGEYFERRPSPRVSADALQ